MRTQEFVAYFGEVHASQPPSGDSLEGIYQARECQLRRILHQQMNMVRLEVRLQQVGFEVSADDLPSLLKHRKGSRSNHFATVLRDKDQMGMQARDDVSTAAEIIGGWHRPGVMQNTCSRWDSEGASEKRTSHA